MSPLDSILGLEGLFIEQVQRAHDIHVWARPRKRACCVYCANPRVRIKATYTRTLKHTRQGNQLMWLHLRVPKYHCLTCNHQIGDDTIIDIQVTFVFTQVADIVALG